MTEMMTHSEVGQVVGVEVEEAGGNARGEHPAGATVIQLDDASDFPELGGQVRVGYTVVDYAAADDETDTLTLAAGCPVLIEDGDRVFVHPSAPTTWAQVTVDLEEGPLLVEVPFGIKAFTGLTEGDLVRFTEDDQGSLRVVEVIGGSPTLHASYVDNAEELLLANRQMLGEKLAENDLALDAARGRLSETESRLNDAFSEIDLKPDSAYVDAARQQAIDAAEIDAQAKADAARNAAVQTAQQALTSAEQELQQAITAGDAAAIADAAQKVATAKAEAIDAAAITAQQKADQARLDAIEAAALDSTTKAAEVMAKATAALTAAEAAQATADNAIRTYYGPTRPWADGSAQPDDVLGDMWYDDNTGQAYRWNGTTWTVIVDQTIGQALAAAQNAQDTADGKITAFYQDTEPLEADEGDLWFDTNDSNKPYHRQAGVWVSIADERIAQQAGQLTNLQQEITGLEGTLDGKSVVWVQATAPTGMTAADKGDIWINDGASPRVTKVWNGAAWVEADSRTAGVVADVAKKITTYYTTNTTAPTGTFVDGDLWIDGNGKIARRSGTSWGTVSDPKALADAVNDKAISRGTDLVTNGTGYLKSNYNFSFFTADLVDAPTGATTAFVDKSTTQKLIQSDEVIPYDPSKAYRFSFQVRQTVAGATNRFYGALTPVDSVGLPIQPVHFAYITGTTTMLAQPLNPGDTTITLTSAANWYGTADRPAGTQTHLRSIVFWDYVDPQGKAWPTHSYSRNLLTNVWADGGIVGNVITLSAPYAGAAKPAGTSVSNSTSGSNYLYMPGTHNILAPEEWTAFSGILPPGIMSPAQQGVASGNYPFSWAGGMPPGTAGIKIGWLLNYPANPANPIVGRQAVAAVSFSDASAAQATAEAAAAGVTTVQAGLTGLEGRVDGKATIYVQTAAPTGLKAADQGDIWIDTSTGRVVKVWNGTTWQEADSRTAQAVADIKTKVTTYFQASAPGGSNFTTGDLWVDANGKISRWSGSAWQVAVDPKALADAAEQAAKTAAAADATSKAAAAEAAAKSAAATDAQAKANAAKTAAEAAAKTYSDQVSSGAEAAAIAAAKADATTKADAAEQAAKSAAAADATSKAAAAEAAAKSAAAADAKTKADAALAAAKTYADGKADEALTDAKAFTTTMTDGLAKGVESTALPGTTVMPKDSVWRRIDSDGRIVAVFTQTASPTGNSWSARPITSEVIDNLDAGKLTVSGDTVLNTALVNEFAAKLANIIEANIGNLTVTGDAHLNELVAQVIAGDTASFMSLTVDQILAGFLQAQWIITESGSIIAGDPEGARVEITSDGIRVYVLGYNGLPYLAVSMINGEVAFAVVDQTRGMLGGISSTGNVTGQKGSFSKGLSVMGTEIVGTLGGGSVPGWMDLLPRGILPGRKASTTTTAYRSAGTEAIYLRVKATLHPNRLYRVVGNMEIQCGENTGVPRQRIRMATGGGAASVSSTLLDTYTGAPGYNSTVGQTTRVEDVISVNVVTKVEVVSSYLGLNASTARANSGDLYIEDVGARGIEPGGGDDEAAKTLYTSTWKATASRGYSKGGAVIWAKENELDLWFIGDTAESAGVLFGGTPVLVDDVSENGRTLPQALTGATIHRVELQVTNAMWWNPDVTNMAFNTLSASTLPSTKVVEGYTLVRDIPEGSAVWVDLDPAWFTNGANRGVTLGDKDGILSGVQVGAGKFQGPNDPDAPMLRITYSR